MAATARARSLAQTPSAFRDRADAGHPAALEFERFALAEEEGQFDLGLHVTDDGGSLIVRFKYNADLFEPETMATDGFDPADAVGFWDTVNRQDWRVCELTQKGVGSRGFSRGRYTANEHTVHLFDRMICEAYLRPDTTLLE